MIFFYKKKPSTQVYICMSCKILLLEVIVSRASTAMAIC